MLQHMFSPFLSIQKFPFNKKYEVGVPSIEEIKRSANNLGEWCQCGECKPMPMERECLCCAEVDAINIFI